METPNTLACVAPHVFHGINTDVTVPESSSVLLKFSGAKPFFLYVSVNIFPGTIIDKYWSEAVRLKNTQVPVVVAT